MSTRERQSVDQLANVQQNSNRFSQSENGNDLSGVDLYNFTVEQAEKLINAINEHRKLEHVKENVELIKRINDMRIELEEQKDHILSLVNDCTEIEKCLENLLKAITDCQQYFEQLDNTTVFFIVKNKLKQKALTLQHMIRTNCTHLLTRITLELLPLRDKEEAKDDADEANHDTSKQLHQLPKFYKYYYGLGGTPLNYSIAFSLSLTAAEHHEDPVAMLILSHCFFHGNGVDKDDQRGLHWLEKSAEKNYGVAKKELAEYLISKIKNLEEVCYRVIKKKEKNLVSNKTLNSSEEKKSEEKNLEKEIVKSEEESQLERAMHLLLDAASDGITEAETNLGILCEEATDYEQALKW
jgi:hypothetical protein